MKKKLLSSILLSAAVVPCAFVMASCGAAQIDTMATVDKGGNYQAASAEQIAEFTNQEDIVNEITTGYHLSAKVESNELYSFVNAYILTDENGVPTESAVKVEMKMEGENVMYSVYVKDGYIYTAMDVKSSAGNLSSKLKTELGTESADFFLNGSEVASAGAQLLVGAEDYLEMIEGVYSMASDKVGLEMAKDGTSTKVHAKLLNEFSIEEGGATMTYNGGDIYVLFEGKQFVGASMEASMSTTYNGETMTGKTAVAISTFDGQIQYPNFNDYSELPDILG